MIKIKKAARLATAYVVLEMHVNATGHSATEYWHIRTAIPARPDRPKTVQGHACRRRDQTNPDNNPAAIFPVVSTLIPIGKIPFVPAGFVISITSPLSLANLFPTASFISVDEKDFSTNVSPGFKLRKLSKYSLLNLSDDIPRNVVIGVSRTGAFEIRKSKSLTILLTFTVSFAPALCPVCAVSDHPRGAAENRF